MHTTAFDARRVAIACASVYKLAARDAELGGQYAAVGAVLAALCGTTLEVLAHHVAVGFLSTGAYRGWSAAALAVRAALPTSRPEPPAELPAGARALATLARARYEQARQPECRGDYAATACALLAALGLPHEATVDAAFAARNEVLEGETAPDDDLAWLRLALTVWERFAAHVTLWG